LPSPPLLARRRARKRGGRGLVGWRCSRTHCWGYFPVLHCCGGASSTRHSGWWLTMSLGRLSVWSFRYACLVPEANNLKTPLWFLSGWVCVHTRPFSQYSTVCTISISCPPHPLDSHSMSIQKKNRNSLNLFGHNQSNWTDSTSPDKWMDKHVTQFIFLVSLLKPKVCCLVPGVGARE